MASADDSSELQQFYAPSKERSATVTSTSVPGLTTRSGGVGDWAANARWTVQGGKDSGCFHFLQSDMVFESPFMCIFNSISSEKRFLISVPFLTC